MPYPPEDYIDSCKKGERVTVREFGVMPLDIAGHYLKREIDVLHDKIDRLESYIDFMEKFVTVHFGLEEGKNWREHGQTKTKD